MVSVGYPENRSGFTLIELLVVLAILALLLTIATPRYIQHVERARETTLRSSLKVMRDAIDKFDSDQGHLPQNLDELVNRNYLKAIPLDPITDRKDTWISLSPGELLAASPAPALGSASTPGVGTGSGMADVRSGAPGNGTDGTPFKEW